MMETELAPVMSVFISTIIIVGLSYEQTLMGKRQVTIAVGQFLYLLTAQG